MSEKREGELELLHVLGGQWTLAMDTHSVVRVDSAPPDPQDPSLRWLAHLLGGTPQGSQRDCRMLALAPSGEHRLVVDRVVGVRTIPTAKLRVLPPTLRHFGVPSWLLGSYWHQDDELILLLSPGAAVVSVQLPAVSCQKRTSNQELARTQYARAAPASNTQLSDFTEG